MKQITSYEFSMDTACVELKYDGGTTLSIDTIAVKNEFAETWLDRRELDYLIYNDPLGYADLVLNGEVKKYFDIGYTPVMTGFLRDIYVSKTKCRNA